MKDFALSMFSKIPNLAVGILYFSQIFFVKIFEPSSWDANLLGPNIGIFILSKKSTIPSTNGFSGPTIINWIFSESINFLRALKSSALIKIFSAILLVPAFPGKQ